MLLWTWVHKYLFKFLLSILLGIYSDVKLLDHVIILCLIFRKCHLAYFGFWFILPWYGALDWVPFSPLGLFKKKALRLYSVCFDFFLISWLENKWKCIPWEYVLKWELRPTHSLCQEKCFTTNEVFCYKSRILVVFERTHSIKYKWKIL